MTNAGLVERLRRYRLRGQPQQMEFINPDGPEAAARIEGLEAGYRAHAIALNALIQHLGGKSHSQPGRHSWNSLASVDEVQAALKANNDAREALASSILSQGDKV
jgi:hypothetical protein